MTTKLPSAPPRCAPCGGSVNPSKWKDHAAFRSAHVEWGTPPDLKADLDKEFGFTLDPCTPGQVWDGTAISWAGHRVFCNPPYGRTLGKWLEKGPEARDFEMKPERHPPFARCGG